MFSRVRIAIRFFFVGLAVGILLAPRKGEDTRRMLREKAGLYGHVASGYWRDIGNLDEYRHAHDDVLRGTVKLCMPGQERDLDGTRVWGESGAALGRDSSVVGSIRLPNPTGSLAE